MFRYFSFVALFAGIAVFNRVFAQEASGPAPADMAQLPAWAKAIGEFSLAAGVITALGGCVEFAMGFFKTDKPKRLAWTIANWFRFIAGFFDKWGNTINKVFPQNVSAPVASPTPEPIKENLP